MHLTHLIPVLVANLDDTLMRDSLQKDLYPVAQSVKHNLASLLLLMVRRLFHELSEDITEAQNKEVRGTKDFETKTASSFSVYDKRLAGIVQEQTVSPGFGMTVLCS